MLICFGLLLGSRQRWGSCLVSLVMLCIMLFVVAVRCLVGMSALNLMVVMLVWLLVLMFRGLLSIIRYWEGFMFIVRAASRKRLGVGLFSCMLLVEKIWLLK